MEMNGMALKEKSITLTGQLQTFIIWRNFLKEDSVLAQTIATKAGITSDDMTTVQFLTDARLELMMMSGYYSEKLNEKLKTIYIDI